MAPKCGLLLTKCDPITAIVKYLSRQQQMAPTLEETSKLLNVQVYYKGPFHLVTHLDRN